METIVTVICFIWIGMVLAISFMEAWLKFRAPGINLTLGLGIGKIVFAALNKIELFFASLLVIFLLLNKENLLQNTLVTIGFIALILLVQLILIMPKLNERADKLIANQKINPSKAHFYYIILEVFKLVSLFILGIQTLN